MLGINMDDVIAVIKSIRVELIVVVLALLLAFVITVAINKHTVSNRNVRKLTHSTTWVVAAVAMVAAVSTMLSGPLTSMITMTTAQKQHLSEQSIDNTNKLAVDIEREGITMLQNNNDMLPLRASGATRNLNVFGWASTNPVYGGTGSGALDTTYPTTSLLDSLHQAGYRTNTDLSKFYTDYSTKRGAIEVTKADWTLPEPPAAQYSDSLMRGAKKFSSTAMVVISRIGGEGTDLPTDMNAKGITYKNNSKQYADFTKGQHYLELDKSEHDMVDLVAKNFENVVLVYNGANAFNLSFLRQYPQIKSALWVPHPGQAGFKALGEVLNGSVNPSGKTSDTFLYDLKNTPSWNNFGDFPYNNVKEFEIQSARGLRSPRFVNYVEGIYVGYRYYESAADEGAINYDDVVQYPFGYGLSYTNFTQRMGDISRSGDKVSFDVTVTNSGSRPGKDVVETYSTPPYTDGGVEKATANLVAFDKTKELKPGESQNIHVTFNTADLASYDYRGAKSYVLDAGDYGISIRSDSHHVIASRNLSVAQAVTYDKASNTHDGDKVAATNRFDDVAGNVTYLSRANRFENERTSTAAPSDYAMPDKVKRTFYNNGNYDPKKFDKPGDKMPTTDAKNGIRLAQMRGKSYNDPMWDKLLDQLSIKEMDGLIANGGYQNAAVPSIGKPRMSDVDGPAALKDNFTGVGSIGLPSNVTVACTWNKDIARRFGDAIGRMARDMHISGWYAPSVNIHRSPFGGRNFEYFSEDPLLTGDMAAGQVLGAAKHGIYSFTKHFALNEQEVQRNGQLCTWSNEQAMREIYLKPFEIVVKASLGTPQAIMGSFNYVGNTYASGLNSLNETVLRKEWGFRGFIVTDYFSGPNYGYQNADQLIRGGTDVMLASTQTTNHVTDLSATSVIQMRRAAKNVLYTTVNSWMFEHGEPRAQTPTWKKAMYVVWVVVAVVLVALEALAIRRFARRRKEARNAFESRSRC